MNDIAIDIQGLSKVYRVGQADEKHDTATGAALAWLKSPFQNFRRLRKLSHFEDRHHAEDVIWALRDISLQVKQGDVIGIIGHNGAGKSTLLKILSRITLPTEGRAELRGRVGSLLEVGTGFHPDLTGRENTYLNGAILGMKRAEIERKFDEIVDFAGVSAFIDTPVKRYSSGMYLRLAFAVAAHLDPEILVVDEVLAVGDHAFQQQCLGKMGKIAESGRTVLFVSHNLAAISALCSHAMLLNHGRVQATGPVADVIQSYLTAGEAVSRVSLAEREDREGDGAVRFEALWFRDAQGKPLDHVAAGQDIEVVVDYRCSQPVSAERVIVKLGVQDLYHRPLTSCLSRCSRNEAMVLPPHGRIVCRIPRLPLLPGRYPFDLWCKVDGEVADWLRPAAHFEVVGGDFFGTGRLPPRVAGDVLLDHEWSVEERTPETEP